MVYFVNLPFFLLFTMGAGLAKNIETLVICRMFSGIFGGPALAVSAGSFVDVWELKSSGLAVSVQAIATFMGPALGKFTISSFRRGFELTFFLSFARSHHRWISG